MDHCRDPVTWKIDAWARALLDRAPNGYVEATDSGTGLRIIGVGPVPAAHRKFSIPNTLNGAGVEVYRKATRYITISCLQIGTCVKLTNIDELIYFIIAQYERSAARQPEQAASPPPELKDKPTAGDIDS